MTKGLARLAWQFRSLRTRLMLIGALCLLPPGLLLVLSVQQHRALLVEEAGTRLVSSARLLAAEHDRIVNEAQLVLKVLGNDPAVRGSDMRPCSRRLEQVIRDAATLSNIVVVSPAGDMICAGQATKLVNIADRPYFRLAMGGSNAVGPLVFARSNGTFLLPIAVPMLGRDQRPWRVMAAAISPQTLRMFAVGNKVADDVELTLLDGAGTVVSSTSPDLASGAPAPWALSTIVPGAAEVDRRLLGVARAAQGALTVVLTVERDAVLASSDRVFRHEVLKVGVLMALVATAAAVAVDVGILRRMRRVVAVAARLSSGEFAARHDLRAGTDEIGQLADALSGMAASLDQRMSDLAAREAEARMESLHDPLTGLPNRRALDRELPALLTEACRTASRVALLALDIDYFKQVNDTHGHAVGDALLLAAAHRMRAALREQDRLVRIAGDEFVVIAVDTEPAAVEGIADRLVRVMAAPFELLGARVETGVSIGIAHFPVDGANAERLTAAADGALYRAKAAGRGRWVGEPVVG